MMPRKKIIARARRKADRLVSALFISSGTTIVARYLRMDLLRIGLQRSS